MLVSHLSLSLSCEWRFYLTSNLVFTNCRLFWIPCTSISRVFISSRPRITARTVWERVHFTPSSFQRLNSWEWLPIKTRGWVQIVNDLQLSSRNSFKQCKRRFCLIRSGWKVSHKNVQFCRLVVGDPFIGRVILQSTAITYRWSRG